MADKKKDDKPKRRKKGNPRANPVIAGLAGIATGAGTGLGIYYANKNIEGLKDMQYALPAAGSVIGVATVLFSGRMPVVQAMGVGMAAASIPSLVTEIMKMMDKKAATNNADGAPTSTIVDAEIIDDNLNGTKGRSTVRF